MRTQRQNKSLVLMGTTLALMLMFQFGCGTETAAIFEEQSDVEAFEQEGEEFDSQDEDADESDQQASEDEEDEFADDEEEDDEEQMDDEASDDEDDMDDSPAGDDQEDSADDEDLGPMDRDTLSVGCDLIEGEYWEEDDEFGCELESGNELLCNDDGECTSGVMMSLDDILERLNILEYYPSILELRVVATFNDGEGPVIGKGETIIIEGETPCNNPGNVYVGVGENAECECDSGFIEVGTEEDGFPMCAKNWHEGGNNPIPPTSPNPLPDPTPPPPKPDPEPTCSEQEFLRDLTRAEQDYKQCIFGAVDSLEAWLQAEVVLLGASFLTLGTSAPVLLGDLTGVTVGSLVLGNSYDNGISGCEYSFCTSIKRTFEDCNVPVPADPPDELCDDNW